MRGSPQLFQTTLSTAQNYSFWGAVQHCHFPGASPQSNQELHCWTELGFGPAIRRHWQWCHSIGHIQLPIISLPLWLCLYLAPFPRYCHLFPNVIRDHDVTLNTYPSGVISINQHPKFEVIASPISDIWLEPSKIFMGHVTCHVPSGHLSILG